MPNKKPHRRGYVILIAAILVLLLMISITGKQREQLSPAEDALLSLFAPVQKVFSSMGQNIQSFIDAIISFQKLRVENERLRSELDFFEGQLIQLQELQKENHRLRRLLDFKQDSNFELLPAKVVARDPSQWFGTITINRGYNDGVQREMPVVTDRGLAGMVSTVSPNSSQVILLTDPRLAVSAMVQRSRDSGVVGIVETYPQEQAYLQMTKLSPEANIQPGDVIISSGLGGIFPKGLQIGTVRKVYDDQYGLMLSALIEPRVNFNRLEEVLIILDSGVDEVHEEIHGDTEGGT